MKKNKLIAAMALSLSLTLVSCSDDKPAVGTQEAQKTATKVAKTIGSQSSLLEYIPAETPILFYYVNDLKNPVPQKLVDKMNGIYSSIGEVIRTSVLENYKGYAKKAQAEDGTDAKKDVATNEVDAMMDKWLSKEGFEKLGLVIGETETAIYAVDLFPVMRINLAKTHSIGELLDELMGKANQEKAGTATKRTVNGHTVYQIGDKEFQAVLTLKNDTIVASFLPANEVDTLMPKIFGFEKPAKSLTQSNNYQDTISKYNYISNSMGWMNIRQIADYFVNPDQYDTTMLDMMKVEDNMFSADCKTEILEIFDKFPRLVTGYTVFNDSHIDSHMIIEMENGLGSKLATMAGRIPTASGSPAMSYGLSFDIAAAKTLALEFVTNIETVPYKCEMLSGMNEKATMMKAQLNQPLPPFVGNFKGMNIVIDKLDLDFTQTDPEAMVKDLKAKVLFALDNPEALKGMAEMMMPELQKLGLQVGAEAVNVSSLIPVSGSQIPVNLDFVFMAMGSETLGVSLGEGTDSALTKDVSSVSTNNLLNFNVEAELYKNLFEGIGGITDQLPEEMKQQINIQKVLMNDLIWWESETGHVDFTDRGFEFNVNYKY